MITEDETYYDNTNILSELTKEAWLLYCSEAGFCAGSVDFWSDLSSDIQRIYIDRILNTNIKIQNMRLITMLEISNNYPDNINIVVTKSSDCEKYTSSLYLMRDGVCHTVI